MVLRFIHFPPAQLSRLKRLSSRLDVSCGALVREAVETMLDKKEQR